MTVQHRKHQYLVGILLLALVLRAAYTLSTPAWRSADEYAHYWVATQIASTNHLPTDGTGFPSYEAYQPPLYYAIASLVLRVFPDEHSEFTEEKVPPPKHLLALRLLSVGLSIITLLLIHRMLERISFLKGTTVMLGTAFAAFLPTYVAVSSSVNNDVMVTLCATASLFYIMTPSEHWTARTAVLSGLWAGLALLSKTTALALAPVIALRVYQVGRGSAGSMLRTGSLAFLGAAGPILLVVFRNVYQFGDALAFMPAEPKEFSFSFPHGVWAVRNLGWSFWLALGRTYDVRPPVVIYAVTVLPMMAIAIAGWVRRPLRGQNRDLNVLTLTAFAMAVVASLAFTLSFPPGHQTSWGKNLFPVLPLLALFFVEGWEGIHSSTRTLLPITCLVVMIAGCLWGLWAVSYT